MRRQIRDKHDHVPCAKCGKTISVRSGTPKVEAGWFDPFNLDMEYTTGTQGAYVHYGCLSRLRIHQLRHERKAVLS